MIELTDWLRAELARRASYDAPEEACGLISRHPPAPGLRTGGLGIWAAENAAEDPERGFEIAPADLLGILAQIEKQGSELVAVYHSHPQGTASPSPADLETASRWPGLTWIIVAPDSSPEGYAYWSGVLA